MAESHRSGGLRPEVSAAPEALVGEGRSGMSLGPVLMGLGLAALLASGGMEAMGLGHNHDPGPRAVPVALAAGLMLAGAWEWWLGWRRRRRTRSPGALQPASRVAATGAAIRQGGRRDVIFLMVSLVGYIPVMMGVGFALASVLLTTFLMKRLGVGWGRSIFFGVLLVGMVEVLFGVLFKVPLPAGGLTGW